MAGASGMGARGVRASGVGASGVGACGIGASGVGASGVGASGVGASGVGASGAYLYNKNRSDVTMGEAKLVDCVTLIDSVGPDDSVSQVRYSRVGRNRIAVSKESQGRSRASVSRATRVSSIISGTSAVERAREIVIERAKEKVRIANSERIDTIRRENERRRLEREKIKKDEEIREKMLRVRNGSTNKEAEERRRAEGEASRRGNVEEICKDGFDNRKRWKFPRSDGR